MHRAQHHILDLGGHIRCLAVTGGFGIDPAIAAIYVPMILMVAGTIIPYLLGIDQAAEKEIWEKRLSFPLLYGNTHSAARHTTIREVFIMECGKLTAKLRVAVSVSNTLDDRNSGVDDSLLSSKVGCIP